LRDPNFAEICFTLEINSFFAKRVQHKGGVMNLKSQSNIMVIGSDAHFCYLMKRYIIRSAHHTSIANIGENTLNRVIQVKPSAIILEIGKPGTIGWKVLGELKQLDDTRHIPVLVFTWHDNKSLIKEAGADFSLEMPILYEDFAKALSQVGI
jgi:CheY-like chemotaxis protein